MFSFLNELYTSKQIKSIFIYQNKILSENWFQVSFDIKFKNWIISYNRLETIIIENQNEIEELKKENKISNNLYDIGILWFEQLNKIKIDLLVSFIQILSTSTFIGFYIGAPDSILSKNDEKYLCFSFIVKNQENLKNFSLSQERSEFNFKQYNLKYEKSIKRRDNILTFQEAKVEILNLYNEIFYNYINYESAGSILIIKTENKVIAALKISNSEMQVITKMKNKINSLLIDEVLNSDIFINKLIKIYSLPRDISIYKSIFNNLILPNEPFLKMKNIQFILQSDELKKKFSNTIKKKQTFSDSLNISTDISQCSSYIKHSSKTTFPLKKETKTLNIDDSFHNNIYSKNYSIQNKQKKKKS